MSSPEAFDYGSIPTGYYDAVFHRGHGIQSKWHQLKFARVRELMGEPRRHLDVGCGPGTFIGTLGEGFSSLGADIAPAQLDFARARYQNATRTFSLIENGRLPADDGSIDAVTMIELVEHLDDGALSQLLGESMRVLSPGGRLIVTTPNYAGAWPLVEWLINRAGPVDYAQQHINRFNRQRLAETLSAAGFTEVTVGAYQFAAPFAASLGWAMADRVAALEPGWLVNGAGLLLWAVAVRPRSGAR